MDVGRAGLDNGKDASSAEDPEGEDVVVDAGRQIIVARVEVIAVHVPKQARGDEREDEANHGSNKPQLGNTFKGHGGGVVAFLSGFKKGFGIRGGEREREGAKRAEGRGRWSLGSWDE